MAHYQDKLIKNLVTEIVASLREFGQAHNLPNVDCTLHIAGRPDGDLKASIKFSEYGYDIVKGRDLTIVLAEFARRQAFARDNAALLLTNDGSEKIDDSSDLPL